MRKRSCSGLTQTLLAMALALSIAPHAASAERASRGAPRAELAAALRGIDDAVPAELLWRLGGNDTVRHLKAIARDEAMAGAIRLRATASLHTLGDAAALAACTALADDAALPTRLRWHAAYGAVVLAGRLDAAQALALVSRWLQVKRTAASARRLDVAAGGQADLAEAAVRGLRHVPGPAALRLLRSAQGDPRQTVRDAAHAVLRRRPGR